MEKTELENQWNLQLLEKIVQPLLLWYDKNARVLPWRENPEPYRVWVSEIMLQQTRVEAVKPYYERFLNTLPTVESLANAPEEVILKLWEGLGYYNRVRNLQKGAQAVMERFGGLVPASFDDLQSLPGIGEYTAGAIASIAFGVAVPAVDGNVLRVASRVLASREDILDQKVKRMFHRMIQKILPESRVGDFNQALMELGATVCVPNGMALCEKCPLAKLCCAREQDIVMELPQKTAKKPRRLEDHTVFLITCQKKIALLKRPEKGLLSGLWELPGCMGRLSLNQACQQLLKWGLSPIEQEALPPAKHIFTHVEWHLTAWAVEVREQPDSFDWADKTQLEQDYTLPFAFKAYFMKIREKLN